jgi:hypothetical protein
MADPVEIVVSVSARYGHLWDGRPACRVISQKIGLDVILYPSEENPEWLEQWVPYDVKWGLPHA